MARHIITCERAQARMAGRNILIVKPSYSMITRDAQFMCTVCGCSWVETATLVINERRGCPNCTGRKVGIKCRVSEAVARERLAQDGRGIEMLLWGGKIISYAVFKCKNGHEWSAMAYSVIDHKRGCPHCVEGGFWTAEKYLKMGHNEIFLYQIELWGNRKRFQKVGVSVKAGDRFDQLRRDVSNEFGGEWQCQMIAPLMRGTPKAMLDKEEEIKQASKKLGKSYSQMGYSFGGATECFDELAVSWQM